MSAPTASVRARSLPVCTGDAPCTAVVLDRSVLARAHWDCGCGCGYWTTHATRPVLACQACPRVGLCVVLERRSGRLLCMQCRAPSSVDRRGLLTLENNERYAQYGHQIGAEIQSTMHQRGHR